MSWQETYQASRHTLSSAIRLIKRGKHIFVGSGAAKPQALVAELVRQSDHFAHNHVDHILTLGEAEYVEQRYADSFRHNAYFIGANVREAVHQGRADYTPVFLSQVPSLMRQRRLPVDVVLLQVSPPDEYGYVNLGVSVDVLLGALEAASLVIAEVNPRMPVIHGAGYVSMDRIHAWVPHESELLTLKEQPVDAVAREIGHHVAHLVDDGSTVQVGIGQLPDAILASLHGKKDLGIWTEMVSDGVIELINAGAVSGRFKTTEPRRVSASFAMGSTATYDALHRNPNFSFHPSDYINDPLNIGRQHKMVAINGALQVDLTGQVCSDSIGTRFYSGIGGQVDFIRGASMCPNGRPIIAVRATSSDGQRSRIVATLDEGAGVVTSRGDVHYVVTEYGIADLHGKSIRQRALALMSIAHPDHRSELLQAAKRQHYVFADQPTPRSSYREEHERRTIGPGGVPMLLRPIRETDEEKIADFFYALSSETVRRRYHTVLNEIPRDTLLRYLTVDDTDNVAIVVETLPGDLSEPEIVGVGRYHANPSTRLGDIAFVIRDDWQGGGLGKQLLFRLMAIARENQLRGFTAEVFTNNQAMLSVFESSGLKLSKQREGSVYELSMTFAESEAASS